MTFCVGLNFFLVMYMYGYCMLLLALSLVSLFRHVGSFVGNGNNSRGCYLKLFPQNL